MGLEANGYIVPTRTPGQAKKGGQIMNFDRWPTNLRFLGLSLVAFAIGPQPLARAQAPAQKQLEAPSLSRANSQARSARLDRSQLPSYSQIYPRYAEVCYATQLVYKHGSSGGSFGHNAMFLRGACRDAHAPLPILRSCTPNEMLGEDAGVSVSMDNNFANVSWVSVEGKNFFLNGGLRPGEALDADRAIGLVDEAVKRGYFEGVRMNAPLVARKPAWRTDAYWTAFQSLGTDYGITLGRDAYCVKIPVTESMMTKIILHLNNVNRRAQVQGNRWSEFGNNCADLIYNALAAAGIGNGKIENAGFVSDILQKERAIPETLLADLARLTDLATLPKFEAVVMDFGALNLLKNENWMAHQPGVIFEGFRLHSFGNAVFEDVHVFRGDPLDAFGADTKIVSQAFASSARTDLGANLELAHEQFTLALTQSRVSSASEATAAYVRYLKNEIKKIEVLDPALKPRTAP